MGLVNVLEKLLELLFPSVCEGCGEVVGTYLCDSCVVEKIHFVKRHLCHVCKDCANLGPLPEISGSLIHLQCMEKTHLDGVIVVAEYSKFIEDYIGDIKYEFYFAMIPEIASIANEYLKRNNMYKHVLRHSMITYVPLHASRKRWRGFNQAEKFAIEIANYWDVPVRKLLHRGRKTHSQVGLGRAQRLRNLRDAFSLADNTELHIGNYKKVVIVDDVMTSGATLEECARVLKVAGCEAVYGLVFARG